MKKDRQELNKSCKDLLEFSAGDLIPMLLKKKKLIHVRQAAFDWYDPKTKETVQVQVTVTRSESDFLKPFETEELSSFTPKP
jgi:hypothetical protein